MQWFSDYYFYFCKIFIIVINLLKKNKHNEKSFFSYSAVRRYICAGEGGIYMGLLVLSRFME
jgi:hypothetical protein